MSRRRTTQGERRSQCLIGTTDRIDPKDTNGQSEATVETETAAIAAIEETAVIGEIAAIEEIAANEPSELRLRRRRRRRKFRLSRPTPRASITKSRWTRTLPWSLS